MPARVQREHGVQLGLLEQAELDQQGAELAVVLRLALERGVEPCARDQAGARQELAKAVIGWVSGLFRQAAAMIVERLRSRQELCRTPGVNYVFRLKGVKRVPRS